MMKSIPLTKGLFAIVDDQDFDRVNQLKWYSVTTANNKIVYAGHNSGRAGKSKYVLMHRFILNARKGERVDHRDRNGLNNTRKNLRICTAAQNAANGKIRKTNTSGFQGASWHSGVGLWRSRITTAGVETHLGWFKTAREAGAAYDREAKRIYGPFAINHHQRSMAQ